jgi:hypothetical protein
MALEKTKEFIKNAPLDELLKYLDGFGIKVESLDQLTIRDFVHIVEADLPCGLAIWRKDLLECKMCTQESSCQMIKFWKESGL